MIHRERLFKSSGLTRLQVSQVARLARKRFGARALGPYVSWSCLDGFWRAHVYVVIDFEFELVVQLEPFLTSEAAYDTLVLLLRSVDMRVAPSGKPIKHRHVKQAISAHQRAVLSALQEHAGIGLARIEEITGYTVTSSAERAVQGLIKRGYVRWERHPVKGFLYFITKEGTQVSKVTT